jgi:hypothetical protein
MALLKFELKQEHLLLLKNLKWSIDDDFIIKTIGEDSDTHGQSPFGGEDVFEDMALILYGRPDDFDPLDEECVSYTEYNDEQKEEMLKLLSELPTALSVVLNRQSFELGNYKSKWYDINWKPNLKV